MPETYSGFSKMFKRRFYSESLEQLSGSVRAFIDEKPAPFLVSHPSLRLPMRRFRDQTASRSCYLSICAESFFSLDVCSSPPYQPFP